MRRRQHPWATSFSKQKQPETLCVCANTHSAVLSVCSPPAKQPSALPRPALCFSRRPPQTPAPGQAAEEQEGATAEHWSGVQGHTAAPLPAPLPLRETGLQDHLQEPPLHHYFTPTCHLQVSCSFKTLRRLYSPLGIANKSPITMHE